MKHSTTARLFFPTGDCRWKWKHDMTQPKTDFAPSSRCAHHKSNNDTRKQLNQIHISRLFSVWIAFFILYIIPPSLRQSTIAKLGLVCGLKRKTLVLIAHTWAPAWACCSVGVCYCLQGWGVRMKTHICYFCNIHGWPSL